MAHLGTLAKGLLSSSTVSMGLQSPQGVPGERPTSKLTHVVVGKINSSCVAGLRTLVPPWLLAGGPPHLPAMGISLYSSSQHGSFFHPSKRA